MTTTNEKLRNVAEIAARIMMGEKALHPNQQKLDVHEPEKDELTADDFKKLRAGKKAPEVKKEEVEQIDETPGAQAMKASGVKQSPDKLLARTGMNIAHKFPRKGQTDLGNIPGMNTPGVSKDTADYAEKRRGDREKQLKPAIKAALGTHGPKGKLPEEVEQIEEMEIVKTATGMRVYGSSYGDSAKARRDQVKRPVDDVKGPKMKELSDIEAEKKKKKKMSEMVALYQEQGLKGLFASLVKEEPDNEQFTKELEAQKAKNAGQGKKAEVAKAEVLAVQEEEFEVVMNEPNGYAEATIEERSMTEPEIKKKEEIVKSMKKGISGFKERYGSRAKNVMYATATKRAMGEEVEQIEEGTPEGYQRRDGKLIPKIHPTMTPHEHGYDYTMQSIEDAPSKAKIHSQHKEIVKDNPHPQGSKEHKDWEAGTNKAKADHLKDFS
jgi:hypothetical protein